ncbi:universal stress protein [Blastochloris viridis]|uniref:Universal stress family protein n=1 Tax=Blastochloris viridis TaxID=1079 RepID=A0A0H5B704_BLAVI|nr:universal stress protein [Blastochloris viridis]ALK08771.1 Universal stress protein G [Blastochloris viridis]BAR97932.1 universal stress family protein [Blastochloris viridis]CUU41432.1 Universal stress protein G [Blastochloris viridis]
MFKKILVPVDLAELDFCKSALDATVSIARTDGAAVRLLNVMQHLPAMMAEYLPADFDNIQQKNATEALAKLGAGLDLHPANISAAVRIGPVHHEVLEEAKEFGADLIVMSSHDPGLRTYFIGSNAAQVVRHAHCSVMVVRGRSEPR